MKTNKNQNEIKLNKQLNKKPNKKQENRMRMATIKQGNYSNNKQTIKPEKGPRDEARI